MWGQRRTRRSPAVSAGRRGSPLPCPPSSVRSGGLLLEDGRTSGLLTWAQAERVRAVGERPASEGRGAMAEKGGSVGCAEQQRQHVDGPEDPQITVSGGRLTEVAHPVGPDRSAGDDERRRVTGVQDPARRGCRVVPGDSDDGGAGEVE